MRVALIIGFVILASTPAGAAETMAARGVGTGTCAEYGQFFKRDPKATDRFYASWAQGFMSGWNFSTLPKFRELGTMSAESHMQHIRLYCDEHPLVPFVRAVMDLYYSLPEKSSK